MKVPGYCNCSTPARAAHEGILMCEACGEPIADPLLVCLLAEVLAQRRRLAELERKLTEPKPRAPDWLAPREFALHLGRFVDFVYRHADELGAKKVGKGPRPRLLFPTDPVSSDDFPPDSAEETSRSRQDGEPPNESGR